MVDRLLSRIKASFSEFGVSIARGHPTSQTAMLDHA